MDNFYSVIKTGLYGVDDQWFYKEEANARKKFNEVAQEIKDQWGYRPGKEKTDDSWEIEENRVDFYSNDYDGDDNFHDGVELKKVSFED